MAKDQFSVSRRRDLNKTAMNNSERAQDTRAVEGFAEPRSSSLFLRAKPTVRRCRLIAFTKVGNDHRRCGDHDVLVDRATCPGRLLIVSLYAAELFQPLLWRYHC